MSVGGFSGGSKISQYMAGLLAEEKLQIKGIYVGGCNQSLYEYAQGDLGIKKSIYRDLKVYMSTGDTDSLVNKEHTKNLEAATKSAGVKLIKNKIFSGGHIFYLDHFNEALDWFSSNEEK
jgi:predicted esterase